MNYVIILFGLLIAVLSLYVTFRPKAALQFVSNRAGSIGLYILAIVARIGMGLVLVLYAEQSRFTHVLEFLGYLFIGAGVILALIGRSRFERLVIWAMDRFAKFTWVSGPLGLILGLFLVYAVI